MRTTLTLADDVAALLKRAQRRLGGTMRDVVNEALRHGLVRLLDDRVAAKPFRTREVALRPRVPDVDDVADVLDVAEGESVS